jgi:hypothetical protein
MFGLMGSNQSGMQGKADAIQATTWMRQNPYSLTPRYRFRNQIQLTLNTVALGDSGAIVMRMSDNKIGGILSALAGPGVAFASPWSEVLRCSRLQFQYP